MFWFRNKTDIFLYPLLTKGLFMESSIGLKMVNETKFHTFQAVNMATASRGVKVGSVIPTLRTH